MNLVMRHALQKALGRKTDPDSTCIRCDGTGQSRETQTTMRKVGEKLVTIALGSGCPACRGKGHIR